MFTLITEYDTRFDFTLCKDEPHVREVAGVDGTIATFYPRNPPNIAGIHQGNWHGFWSEDPKLEKFYFTTPSHDCPEATRMGEVYMYITKPPSELKIREEKKEEAKNV